MYKFIGKQLPVQFDNYFDNVHAIHKRSTRTSQMKNQLYIPRFRTNRLQRSIKYRGVKVWNDIPNEIKNNKCNFSAFKRINKKYLISRAGRLKKHTVKRKRKFRNQNFSTVKRKRKFRNQKFLRSKRKRKFRNQIFLRVKRKRKFRNQN